MPLVQDWSLNLLTDSPVYYHCAMDAPEVSLCVCVCLGEGVGGAGACYAVFHATPNPFLWIKICLTQDWGQELGMGVKVGYLLEEHIVAKILLIFRYTASKFNVCIEHLFTLSVI